MENQLRRVRLFGLSIDIVNDNNFDQVITKLQVSTRQEQIKFLTYRELIASIFNKEKKMRINSCSLVIPTSFRIQKAVNFIHKANLKLYNQFNFVIKLLGFVESQKGTVYLIGGKNKETFKSESNLKTSFPGIRFVGRFNGNFKKNHETNLIEAVRKASPTLLLTGEGIRLKDKWLYKNRQLFSEGMCLYSDDCFQVITGRKSSKKNIIAEFIKRPWIILEIFSMTWFYLLLIFQGSNPKD